MKKEPEKRKRRTKITSKILEEMVGLRKRGLTYEEIAARLNITSVTVAKYLRREGLGGRKKKVTGEVLNKMDNLVRTGMHKKEIADKLSLSYGTVLRYLKEEKLGSMEKLKKWIGLK